MSETRRQYLERVSRVHDEWVKKYQDQVPLNPDAPPGSDYNEWIVDMDASPEAQSEFMRATAPPLEGFAPEPDDEVPMSDPYTEAKIARVSMCRAARGVADALLDHSMTVEEAEEQLGIAKREFAQRRSDTGDELYPAKVTEPDPLNELGILDPAADEFVFPSFAYASDMEGVRFMVINDSEINCTGWRIHMRAGEFITEADFLELPVHREGPSVACWK